jgi:phosphoribosylaminoimidazole carboxylase
VLELASISDILTVEIEHINCDALDAAIAQGTPVQPLPQTLRVIQDKYAQKVYLAERGIPLPEFCDVPDMEAAYEAGRVFGYPLMLKAKRLAYDGKGNAVAKTKEDVAGAFEQLGGIDVYAEKWAPFVKELAVMVVRSASEVRPYPVVETVQKDNICHITITPAQLSATACNKALAVASQAIAALEGAGIFGVELFLMPDDSILLNEIAPRPHNSGHYTMEACETDQFENHLRAVLDLPLGGTALKVGAAVMLNILGEGDTEETKKMMQKALAIPGAGIHWYGKGEAKKGRKMAHITFTGHSLFDIKARTAVYGGLLGSLSLAPSVGIIMGSDSDLPCMKDAAEVLETFGVPYELTIVSAHRTPTRMYTYAQEAAQRGLQVIIAGAGGAAHLPGMVAALTPLPVIGVPVKTAALSGVDSLYSICQMPKGIPVATVAIGNAANAGLLAVRILGSARPELLNKMEVWLREQEGQVLGKAEKLEKGGWKEYLHGPK